MNHKYKATDLFPTWYKSVDPTVDALTVGNRITAINVLLNDDSNDTWFTIVRIALGIVEINAAKVEAIEREFKNADIQFPLVSNEHLMQVLSQISLCYLFESDNKLKELVALAVSNTVFLREIHQTTIPYIQYAEECLTVPTRERENEGNEYHQQMMVGLTHMAGSEDEPLMDYEDQIALLNTVDYLFEANKKLQHESNILWWLFGQYSTIHDKYFSEAGLLQMIFASAIELNELSQKSKNLSAAKHLLHKALIISNDNKVLKNKYNLFKVINETHTSVISQILNSQDSISEFTPCLLSISLATHFKDQAVWKVAVKAKIPNGNLDQELLPTDIAMQVYNELVFLSSLKS